MLYFAQDVVAALLTSSLYTTVFYPIHRVKVLLQTQDSDPDVRSGRVTRYRFSTSFQRMAREGGWTSLWRGCTPYMLRHVPSTTLSFAFKDGLQRVMPAFDPATQQELYAASRLAAGGVAGVLALAVVYPLDLTTIRMAANVGAQRDQGMMETIQGSTRRGGIAGLYRGFTVSAVAIGGYKALYFGLYDIAKTYYLIPDGASAAEHTSSKGPHAQAQASDQPQAGNTSTAAPAPEGAAHVKQSRWWRSTRQHDAGGAALPGGRQQCSAEPGTLAAATTAAASSVAAAQQHVAASQHGVWTLLKAWAVASGVVYVASAITYPLDVLRKRWVVDCGRAVPLYASPLHCFKSIMAKEGILGFYRFFGHDMLLRSGGGILLVAYDELRTLQRQQLLARQDAADGWDEAPALRSERREDL